MFDENFIKNLPENKGLAGRKICASFMAFHANLSREEEEQHYEEYLKALAIVKAFAKVHDININDFSLTGDIETNISAIVGFFEELRGGFDQKFTESTLEQYTKLFERQFGKGFHYEFSDGDLKRIQVLINELREVISETADIDEDHKSRLLKRLEKLQSEIHKTVSDLDKFWGLLIDGSIVLKKVGENAKPIVDRIQEIANIVWRVQARAEELPSNIPFELPSEEPEDKA